MSRWPTPAQAERVAAAKALPPRHFCHACHRGWPELLTVVIDRYGAVAACVDPTSCREHAIKVGLWKRTAPTIWPLSA